MPATICPIPYTGVKMFSKETIQEFDISDKDLNGFGQHIYDHIKSNIKIASNYKEMKQEQQKFRNGTLNRIHVDNINMM